MKAVVVFYSMQGNTRYVAEKIAEQLNADMLELKAKKDYPTKGFVKYFWGGGSVMLAKKPELEQYDFPKEKYDVVVIGTPIWAGTFTPPIRTFLSDNSLEKKNIALFACHGGGGSEKCMDKIKKVLGIQGEVPVLSLTEPAVHKEKKDIDEIADFCEKIKNTY